MDNKIYMSSINNPKYRYQNKGRQKEACPSLDDYDGYDSDTNDFYYYDDLSGNDRRKGYFR